MRFEWDEEKNRANIRKHRVSFDTAKIVFEDPRQLSIQDRYEGGEERWQTIGLVRGTRLIDPNRPARLGVEILLVAHTWREEEGQDVIRIISARKAAPAEQRRYHEAI